MPGGVAAIREPWRMAAAWLASAVGADAAVDRLGAVDERAAIVVELVERGTGPTTTSRRAAVRRRGRCARRAATRVTFEAQAAIELEAAGPHRAAGGGAGAIPTTRPVTATAALAVLDPARCSPRSSPTATPACRRPCSPPAFHEALGAAVAALAASLAAEHGLDTVALTGGVFQNVPAHRGRRVDARHGFDVLVHARIPANDGGISIGQAAIAAWQLGSGTRSQRSTALGPWMLPSVRPAAR